MSKQGNIVIKYFLPNGGDLIFTTRRWGGSDTPQVAQRAIRQVAIDNYTELRYIYEEICHCISHDGQIDRPILVLGNADTPTVVIDCWNSTVAWVDPATSKELKKWSYDDYLKEGFDYPYEENDYTKYYLD